MGFRPFIYRLAVLYGLKGKVDNRNWGVLINIEGEEEAVKKFLDHIVRLPPDAAQVKSVETRDAVLRNYTGFSIAESLDENPEITEVSPDIAVCHECIQDLQDDPFRRAYPFTNCTSCGPRFTIIENLPYDRVNTSMKEFSMCGNCKREYGDILNRRFHAQPVACNNCGPVYRYEQDGIITTGITSILNLISARIMTGKAAAVKGTGGYHLICNALDNEAVGELRVKKRRDAKPFAVMFRDILAVEEYCQIGPVEYRELTSWRRPILILKQLKGLPEAVSNGLGTIGAILPYMPIHYMLFSKINTPAIVFTSGNISEEPLIKDDQTARENLLPVTGALLSYNREIINRADDSVIRIINEKPGLIRRSRGYVPSPVDLQCDAEGILALGAELKNSFCIGRGKQAIMSQFIGDLKNLPAFDFYNESLERFNTLFRFRPRVLACDLHPDYLSSVHAEKLQAELGVPLVRVQHHHAHIASCMAEHQLDGKVIGISLDGTGYGTDGNIWGGEFLIAGLKDFTRYSHFDYIPLPGGDKAADEPWRSAYSYLYRYFGDRKDFNSLPCFRNTDPSHLSLIRDMLDRDVNSPLSSGAGRLFDAVSAILGLCTVSGFDSEAPMRLESVAATAIEDYYPFEVKKEVVFAKTIDAILGETGKVPVPVIAARFHNTVAMAIAGVAERIRKETSINRVVLSGGVFQNKYLLEKTGSLLRLENFEYFTNHQVPANDGGISLGQLIIASKSI